MGITRFYLLHHTMFSPEPGDEFLIICISADGPSLDALCEEHFGRAPFLIMADMDSGRWWAVENRSPGPCGGKIPGPVRILGEQRVTVLITGRVGGTGQEALERSGIRVFLCPGGISVGDALRRYRNGELPRIA
jgi:predicted Fe-Mo cluster-binding NifX family protein